MGVNRNGFSVNRMFDYWCVDVFVEAGFGEVKFFQDKRKINLKLFHGIDWIL